MEQNKKVLSVALSRFGMEFQLDLMVEECAELIKAIQKFKRYYSNPAANNEKLVQDVQGEIADVELAAETLRMIFGSESIDIIKQAKIERLKKTLDYREHGKI